MDTYEVNNLYGSISILQRQVRHLEIASRATAKMLSDYDLQDIHRRISAQEARALNADVDKQQDTAMREAAARAQAIRSFSEAQAAIVEKYDVKPLGQDLPSRRSDVDAILQMTAFIRRLLSPEDFGYAVTEEVRTAALKALGLPQR